MKRIILFIVLILTLAGAASAQKPTPFTVGQHTFLLDGKPFVIKAAEIHYPRIPRPYWEHRIRMCKALGMNTLCLYVFWNIHEQQEGVFDFTGNNDVAAFCRLAQEQGMYIIVRPGPYVCAEWEMGGLPWWLLKKKDIRLREQDPYFMERVRLFEQEVGKQLAPLTIDKGGPILMVQVENEYGSYGEDKAYISAIRDIVKTSFGIKGEEEQPGTPSSPILFQCDWASNFTKNGLDDLVWTMNFGTGSNIDDQFRHLKDLRPETPLMCSEFWSGWFDKWGARHETRPATDMVAGIDEMLAKGISFSLYMTHGGTSFGHWAGANSPGFAPDVTSYDYDAPINEYGLPTEKYWILRKTMEKYADRKLPAVPKAPMPLISVPEFQLKKVLNLDAFVSVQKESRDILTMEDLNTGWGMIHYTTTLPDIPVNSLLTLNDCHDFAVIYINGRRIGTINRVKNEKTLVLPSVGKGDTLTILVEAMGRINFGRAIKDYKGITQEVTLQAEVDGHETTWNLKNWLIQTIADDYSSIRKAMDQQELASKQKESMPGNSGYYFGEFTIKKVGDTFLHTEAFGKGQVWVNGHALGRFWSIGPQQTLYIPGCWLRKGRNEVVVLDIIGPKGEPKAFCQDHPELDKLNLEQTNKHNQPGDRPDLNSRTPLIHSRFANSYGWQKMMFPSQGKGRYVAIECLSTHTGNTVTAAEIYLLDAKGNRLNREQWAVKYADSENEMGNHTGDKAFDLQESTYWQTVKATDFPHLLVIDLGSEQEVAGIEYLPRTDQNAPGNIKDYKVYCY